MFKKQRIALITFFPILAAVVTLCSTSNPLSALYPYSDSSVYQFEHDHNGKHIDCLGGCCLVCIRNESEVGV